ncbi:hypothetical protein E2C01_083854 [Portunus trituberculatus]|uniref:Uncharacterized protein n=1 Tax=Portunus trituberculatus TaxID=210409 RepID=A0A5B7IWA1_PORTR|nr:hypothetical protein [Portunus trituberculatus]
MVALGLGLLHGRGQEGTGMGWCPWPLRFLPTTWRR